MKKFISLCVFSICFSYAYAATPVCTDITANLSKGNESKSVLSLQNFLYAKGILKVMPNGYFGVSTFSAMKAYQKSQGLPQVGNLGPGTRAAIKKETCSSSSTSTFPPVPTSSPSNQTVTINAQVPQGPIPSISSFEYVSLFAQGTTNWNFSMYGTNFSTSSNIVVFRNADTRKSYTIGTLPSSATGTVITLPTNLTGTAYPCGNGCNEMMDPGTYQVTVTTPNGTSDPKIMVIHPFTLSVQNLALNGLSASASNNKLGTISFSTSEAVDVTSLLFSVGTSSISGGGLGNFILKDEGKGVVFAPESIQPFQSYLISLYGDTNNTTPGTISGTFTVTIHDYIGKHDTTFTSKSLLFTVAGVL